MGLDVIAYRNLRRDDAADPDKCLYIDPDDYRHQEGHWPGRQRGLAAGVKYVSDDNAYTFRVGSYIHYGRWRDWLARLVGHRTAEEVWGQSDAEGPFVELINFSDCDGVIGAVVAAKLAADFRDWAGRAKLAVTDTRFEWRTYQEFRTAFEMAADGGAVEFT